MSPWFLYSNMQIKAHANEVVTDWVGILPCDQKGLCHGMTESVKVHRKDQSVKDFTSKCLFLLFWPISCDSLISLIEI